MAGIFHLEDSKPGREGGWVQEEGLERLLCAPWSGIGAGQDMSLRRPGQMEICLEDSEWELDRKEEGESSELN